MPGLASRGCSPSLLLRTRYLRPSKRCHTAKPAQPGDLEKALDSSAVIYNFSETWVRVILRTLCSHLEPAEDGGFRALQDLLRALQQRLEPKQADQGLVQGGPHRIWQRGNTIPEVSEGIRHPMKAAIPPHQRTCAVQTPVNHRHTGVALHESSLARTTGRPRHYFFDPVRINESNESAVIILYLLT